MAIFRGTGGSGNSTDDSIVSAVTEQAGIATTKAGEAATSATTATTKASEASASATTASTKATEANTAKNLAEDARNGAQAYRDTALQAASTAGSHATAAEASAQTANNSSVQTVAGISTEVQNVNNIRTEIQNVDTIKTDVTTVAGISSNVTTVAADASDIGTVATNIANVNNVGDNIANVNAVHNNASNINTVAGDASDIGIVSSNISNVNTVAGISSDVTTVSGLESKMDTVIADASDIGAVANNIGDVTTVAGINSEVDTVAGISAKVTTVADNITDVQNADTNAANASASASQAANSASAAGASATTASTKATEASNSATAASNSATTATTKATEAAGSATTATTKATEASTSATNAATSATTATTKASEAASSATAASGSATTATTKASEADASATSAASSATDSSNAASAWSSFYNSYLGTYSSAPSVDVQGNPIVTGAFYYDTGTGSNTVGLYVYNGSSWVYSTNYNNVTAPYSLAQDLATNSHDINFGDNAKANFGASDDLQIYHDGSNSYIKDSGTGNLWLQGSSQVNIGGANGTIGVQVVEGANVTLRHNNSPKLATTSTGIDVTGSATMDGLTVDGNNDIQINRNGTSAVKLFFDRSGTVDGSLELGADENLTLSVADDGRAGQYIYFNNNTKRVMALADGGDISFYEDTGTTPKFFWDASAESLGIGTDSPASKLHINSGTANQAATFESTDAIAIVGFKDNTTSNLIATGANGNNFVFYNGSERLRIDSSGHVGIGTTSPQDLLHINSDTTDARLLLDGHTDFDAELKFAENGSVKYTVGHDAATDTFRIGTTNVDTNPRLVIDSTGHVGIGTTSPSMVGTTRTLHINGNSGGGGIRLSQGSVNSGSILYTYPQGISLETSNRTRMRISANLGDVSFYENSGTEQKFYWDASAESLGIGTTTPAQKLDVTSAGTTRIQVKNTNLTSSGLYIAEDGTGAQINEIGAYPLRFNTSGTERMRIDSSGNVGIGTTSPDTTLDVHSSTNGHGIYIAQDNVGYGYHTRLTFQGSNGSGGYNTIASLKAYQETNGTNGYLRFDTNGDNERMRIDSSGNLLVGKTANDNTTVGFKVENDGFFSAVADGNTTCVLNRLTSDGEIAIFRKDNATVGSIGTGGGDLNIGTGDTRIRFNDATDNIIPLNASNGYRDNAISIGDSTARFKDIYRSGSTYSTSDRNKKQDIRDLTDAEARVAVVAKGSLKAFRYIDTVEAEGDDANIHFGIIAQDLKAAFEAEGLNANNYQVLKTSTYTDDDGVEQTTYSVCYENLLAFIISAI